ncbi:MAG: phosphoglucosamine mutase, partial [Gammaproteobacteria bacterium]|nr:phosphoglucosamine mutase [Gammaproteobacteria bacterium]
LSVMKRTGKRLAELTAGMTRFPQVLVNVRTARRVEIDNAGGIRNAIAEVEGRLGDRGRVVVRASGTEPVVRVMVEGQDQAEVRQMAEQIAQAVAAAAPV